MKYTEAGEYELPYSATDSCGNTTEQIRNVVVEEVTPPEERLLVTGGAEEFWVSASGSTSHDINTTSEYDGNYEGACEIRIKNYQYSGEDTEEWTPAQDVRLTSDLSYSPTEIFFSDVDLPNGSAYLHGNGETIAVTTEQDYGDGYKWDSLEIWTKTE